MAPRGALLLSSFVVFALLRLIVRQLETIDSGRDNFEVAEGNDGHTDVTYMNKRSHPAPMQAVHKLIVVVAVSIAFAILVLVVRYACRKKSLEHHSSRSSSSSRLKRKRQRSPSTSSSTTDILAEDALSAENASTRKLMARDNEVCELKKESRGRSHCRHRGRCLQDSSVPPRHAPCYIKHLAANSFKHSSGLATLKDDYRSSSDCDEEVELCLYSTPGPVKADKDRSDKLLGPKKRRRLDSLARRKTGLDTDLA
ncbi:hypothetical protein HPB50_003345 [Hyalomma asiaticum]|uniref:Uncharacterized protein n=1 Tax=Hyalomma asiaticum TaxID=266040 RepID=A0ACB7TE09_HYAAI|nr:hypothetical protein HPB50_003345 [Hyalomma asiaticum]